MTDTLDQLARTQIRKWLDSTGTTQTELGARIGRNQSWISRYLKAEFDADLETLQRMTRVFGHELTSALNIPINPDEAQLVTTYRALRPEVRRLVLTLIENLGRGTPRGGRSRR